MIVVGLDLSLTATGIALMHHGADGLDICTNRVTSKGRRGATTSETAARITKMVREINGWVFDGYDEDLIQPTALAVIESPSFGSTGGAAHERGGLWWGVAGELTDMGIPIATVAPATREVYAVGKATGKGAERKKRAKLAIQARYGHLCEIPDDNVADAVALAAMGMRHLGAPIEDNLPEVFTRAMASAKWPS